MLKILPRIPLYQLFRQSGRPGLLPINLTIVPSIRCNSRCLTCNIWNNHEDDLSLGEWERIFRNLGTAPFWVTISGGEPFLNPQLVELTQMLNHYCKPGIINIPSNGLLYQIVPEQIAAIAESCPETQIIINLSLDGVGAQHDHIRGVPGSFGKFVRTYTALNKLDYPNLEIGIHTVISRLNAENIEPVFDYALGLEPDSYITEIAEERVELGTVGLDITPSAAEYWQAIEALIDRLKRQHFSGTSRITQAFRLEYYSLVKRILVEQSQVIPCYAGWASAQISASGNVWACCVRGETILNLRDVGYDFRRVWFGPEAERIRQSIRNRECHCPLANAAYTNMLCHLPSLARVTMTLLKGLWPHPNLPAQPAEAMP